MENRIITNKIDEAKRLMFPRLKDYFIIFFIFLSLTFLVSVIVLMIYFFRHDIKSFSNVDFGAILKYLIQYTYIIPMVLTIVLTLVLYGIRPIQNIRPVYVRYLPLIILLQFLLMIVLDGIMRIIPGSGGNLERLLKDLVKQHFAMTFFVLAVAAPVLEEFLFRGIILKFLLRKTGPWHAITVSAFVFAVFHLNLWQGIGAFLMGIYFGYLYWKTGSLFYPVLLHFVNNATAVLIMAYKPEASENFSYLAGIESDAGSAIFYGAAAILFSILFIFLDKWLSNSVKKILYLASNNPHKYEEIHAILPPKYELKKLSELDKSFSLKETGKTLSDNSLQKAFQIASRFGVDVISDDTGLEVEALNYAPGVYSARYAGANANAEANRKKLLDALAGQDNRRARFRTVLTLINGNDWRQFEGKIEGRITEMERGEGGFGYDSIFTPEGFNETFAQMPAGEKNRISHRARALEKMIAYLKGNEPQFNG